MNPHGPSRGVPRWSAHARRRAHDGRTHRHGHPRRRAGARPDPRLPAAVAGPHLPHRRPRHPPLLGPHHLRPAAHQPLLRADRRRRRGHRLEGHPRRRRAARGGDPRRRRDHRLAPPGGAPAHGRRRPPPAAQLALAPQHPRHALGSGPGHRRNERLRQHRRHPRLPARRQLPVHPGRLLRGPDRHLRRRQAQPRGHLPGIRGADPGR
ncbi:Uncharacterised protein [Mycobacteroides abscessus subsp. abscessus]|nr:Uncharacterised protein [Mycobacteroides abscessus subsp. abscessus]